MSFKGRVALVTGGGSGMGQRACERLAASGAQVAALDINEEGLARTAASSDLIHAYTCDVTDTGQVDTVVGKVTEELGPIDRAVTAAGIMPSGLALDMDVEIMHKVIDVNVKGVINVVKATLPGQVERRFGDQIMFASLMGLMGVPYLSAYCASKFAVRAFAEITYHENRSSGVRFACVCPPLVPTPLLDQMEALPNSLEQAKPMSPDEVLDAVESTLDKGKFWVVPGQAKIGATMARLAPSLTWKNLHKIEGIA